MIVLAPRGAETTIGRVDIRKFLSLRPPVCLNTGSYFFRASQFLYVSQVMDEKTNSKMKIVPTYNDCLKTLHKRCRLKQLTYECWHLYFNWVSELLHCIPITSSCSFCVVFLAYSQKNRKYTFHIRRWFVLLYIFRRSIDKGSSSRCQSPFEPSPYPWRPHTRDRPIRLCAVAY